MDYLLEQVDQSENVGTPLSSHPWAAFAVQARGAVTECNPIRNTQVMKRPRIVAVCGFSSDVGKTTLMCALLRACQGWEAIKITRGHYRSCGKDPHYCCVSHLLTDEAIVYTGHSETYTAGKDTGKYWDAGASNVHWVIAKSDQVEQGVSKALTRVTAPGVFIEGTSFLDFVPADCVIMVSRASGGTIKSSARRALRHAKAIYLSQAAGDNDAREKFANWVAQTGLDHNLISSLPIYTEADLENLIALARGQVAVAATAETAECL